MKFGINYGIMISLLVLSSPALLSDHATHRTSLGRCRRVAQEMEKFFLLSMVAIKSSVAFSSFVISLFCLEISELIQVSLVDLLHECSDNNFNFMFICTDIKSCTRPESHFSVSQNFILKSNLAP